MQRFLYIAMGLLVTVMIAADSGSAAMSVGIPGDGVTDLNVRGRDLMIDTDGVNLNGFILRSDAGLLTGEPYGNDLGIFVVDEDDEISDQVGYVLNGVHGLGLVLGEATPFEQLQQDLTFTYTIEAEPGIHTATIMLGYLGDLDDNGFVGQDDLDIVLGAWGTSPPSDTRADPSGDNFVGQDDLDTVLGDWGQGTPPPSVPEPAILSLLALGVLATMRRRR